MNSRLLDSHPKLNHKKFDGNDSKYNPIHLKFLHLKPEPIMK